MLMVFIVSLYALNYNVEMLQGKRFFWKSVAFFTHGLYKFFSAFSDAPHISGAAALS